MSRIVIVILIYHRHKLIELMVYILLFRFLVYDVMYGTGYLSSNGLDLN
jgi:hypothetical protein